MFPFKEGYVSIPKGLLEEANVWELTELLLTYCAEDYSVEVVSEVLKATECEPLPEWLFRLIGKAEQPPKTHVSRHRTAVVLSSKIIQGLEELVSSERATKAKGSLKRFGFFSDEMICKGREQLIEIIEEDLDFVLHTLHSCSVITLQEYKDVFKMETDSKEKIKKLLSIILERGEQACCRFLECLEMSCLFKNKVQVSGQSLLQSESLLFREETRNQQMVHSEDPGESVMCIHCPSEELPGKIRPEKVWDSQRSDETYRFCFTKAGSFLCCCTDLIFKVRGAVTITYHFDSWPQHLHEWQMIELAVAGPLLNIRADPEEAVAEVHFPHFLCLAGKDSSHVYIACFVEGKMRLGKPDSVRPYHAVLKAPSFYSCGVIFKKAMFKQKIMVHTMALLYQELEISVPKFHLYLLPNDSSLRKNVYKFEEMWPSRRLSKPSGALKPLKIGSRVFIQNLDGVTVCPEVGDQR
ncbi:NACHT, LRR and PYD domains-containing protein 1b allele 5-like [Lacerta agilis]|uniref:NACHT, LRR and PYD domains-containing protein 1b allele 5-like n=1 Tax=Lacerta agilis TaxID=80427 RepID=UPI001419A3E0|nr:NACHT, LRR and PYD domains-containing protein 1b allele 5-like [Lacerta agilis]